MFHPRQIRRSAHLAAALVACAFAALAHAQDLPPYKDSSLPFEKRVADLLSRMTFEEKADQLQVMIPANARLGIPACRWGTEAMHGLPSGTMFPDSTALGATWNPDLIQKVASAIGDEAHVRATPNGVSGLILWCPNLNLVRDPRSGRNMETYGEDPYLAGRLGIAYCKGIQGDDPKYLKAIATPKHFAVYSMEAQRASSNAYVSQRALQEYYLRPFGMAIMEGGAGSVMSAYNAINSIPCSGNEWLLTTVLRDQWHFEGAVVTDSGAVGQMTTSHRFTDSEDKAVAAAINAGVDLITGSAGGAGPSGPASRVTPALVLARDNGLLKESVVDRAAARSLLMRFKLGQFDPPENNPYSKLTSAVVNSPANQDLAAQSAREAITLLQNNPAPKGYGLDKLLPIDLRRVESIAIIGPYAQMNLYGSYAPNGSRGGVVSPAGTGPNMRNAVPLEAIRAIVGDRVIIRNALPTDTDTALEAAKMSDIVIFIGGLDNRADKAGSDRPNLNIPLDQPALLDKILRVNPMTILVLNGGSAMALEDLKAKVPAIVVMWYAGEQGGGALADILFGRANPAGRLPITFYRSSDDLPPMDDYELTKGRTYLYFQKPVTFPFGHGLSYTTFAYDNLKISPPAIPGGPIAATLDVTNTGTRDGDEVVQLYVHKTESAILRPIKQLVAFQRITIPRGQKKTVTLSAEQSGLAYWSTDAQKFIVDPGEYEFMAGASSEDIRLRAKLDMK